MPSSKSASGGGSPGPVRWRWPWWPSPAALIAGAALLLTRDQPAAAPAPPPPVAQARAERLLESQFANAGYDDTAAVSCRRAIRLGSSTRCQVRYANGDTQLILVGLDGRGDLDITIPYPAQRRPGG